MARKIASRKQKQGYSYHHRCRYNWAALFQTPPVSHELENEGAPVTSDLKRYQHHWKKSKMISIKEGFAVCVFDADVAKWNDYNWLNKNIYLVFFHNYFFLIHFIYILLLYNISKISAIDIICHIFLYYIYNIKDWDLSVLSFISCL